MAKPFNIRSFFKPRRDRAWLYALLGLAGLWLGGHVWITLLSDAFIYGRPAWLTPTPTYIALASGLGLGCAALAFIIPRLTATGRLLALVFIVGLVGRAMMFISTPVLEDDWHRYLWDGAVVAHGVDPYKYAPAEATPVTRLGDPLAWSEDPGLATLQELTEEDFEVYWRVNYPYFKTIYPPIAQAGFAFGYVLAPFNLNGWRAVLLLFDLTSFALIVFTLGLYGRSSLWVGLYWWNPVVTLEVFNAGHMDGLIVPFLVGTLALAKLGRLRLATLMLAGAAGVKLWPALLAPALIRPHLFRPLHMLGFASLFIGAALLLLWPQLHYVFTDPDQGLTAYSESWRRHAFLFSVLADGVFLNAGDPGRLTRNVVAFAIAAGALFLAWRSPKDGSGLPMTMLAVTTLLLFLSPTGYPWYQVWIAGFIPFVPRAGFLALIVTAPLYYTRFLYGDSDPFYQWVIVPIAFGVPIGLLIAETAIGKMRINA